MIRRPPRSTLFPLHDALPICKRIGIVLQDFRLLDHMTTYENVALPFRVMGRAESSYRKEVIRSEEHTSELQSHLNIVCRLLLEKKKNTSLLHAQFITLGTTLI